MCVYMCVRERERERVLKRIGSERMNIYVCVCVCVTDRGERWNRKRDREGVRKRERE
jgi:hypothetical protein